MHVRLCTHIYLFSVPSHLPTLPHNAGNCLKQPCGWRVSFWWSVLGGLALPEGHGSTAWPQPRQVPTPG
eukprot:8747854-Alexandrium_andersonii.AAC.1